jgi:hypothetical protein
MTTEQPGIGADPATRPGDPADSPGAGVPPRPSLSPAFPRAAAPGVQVGASRRRPTEVERAAGPVRQPEDEPATPPSPGADAAAATPAGPPGSSPPDAGQAPRTAVPPESPPAAAEPGAPPAWHFWRRWRKPAPTADGPSTPDAVRPVPGDAGPQVTGDPAQPGDDAPKPAEDLQQTGKRKSLPTERPPGAPPDPWTAFARTSERPPSRIRRTLRIAGRGLIHEYAVVVYVSLVLAVGLTWPALRYPLHTVPQELGNPARQAWQIAWSGHILRTHPAQLWHANAYFPERYSFAFGGSLLGYAPAGMIGDGPLAATLRYNILFVLAHALLLIGGYALVRQLGSGRTGAAVAAAALAFAPWRLAQEGQLDIVSAGGIPLALAMLARGHGLSLRYGLRPERRHAGWATAGWLVAIWQITLGFSLGLPFAYVLGGIVLVMLVYVPIRRLRRRGQGPVLGWQLIIIDVLGALIFTGVAALIALPYFKPADSGPSTAEIAFYSPPVRSLLIAPADSRIWGSAHAAPRASLSWPAEMTLLPGFVLYALALIGLVFSVWTWWQRLLLTLGLAAATIVTLGTTFFHGRWTYLPLFGHFPASFGVRVPGRLMLWVTLLLALLAAGAVAEFVRRAEHMSAQRIPPWPGPWLRLATLVPLVLVLVEGINATPHPVVPAQPPALRTITAPMVVLPTTTVLDETAMLWSTSRFQPLANGAGGFAAARQAELRRTLESFPDQPSIQYLRSIGVTTVVLLRAEAQGTPWERAGDVPVDALGIRREDLDENTVVFRLN